MSAPAGKILAITGGTGFVWRRLIDLALESGHKVRALTRREQEPRTGVTWIRGALDTPDALVTLARGADVVIHVAGVVNAPDRAGFVTGNIEGTRAVLAAAEAAGVARFVHVSSLAAREPGLSIYGWSKAEAERLVTESTRAWTVVRPPGVYGPGDMDFLEIFRLARHGLAFLPPGGRMSLIEVSDLGRMLLAAADAPADHALYEPDDGTPGGWTHRDFAQAVGKAVTGHTILALSLPRFALFAAGRIDRALRGARARLTPDRAAYFCHPDWVSAPERHPPAALWQPRVPTAQGLAETVRWYRAQGLL